MICTIPMVFLLPKRLPKRLTASLVGLVFRFVLDLVTAMSKASHKVIIYVLVLALLSPRAEYVTVLPKDSPDAHWC